MKTNNLLMLISICIIVSCTNRTKQSVADVSVTRQQLIDYEKINDIIEDANGYIWFATSGVRGEKRCVSKFSRSENI